MSPATTSEMGPPLALAAIAEEIRNGDELTRAGEQYRKRPDNVLGMLLRDLNREEIAVLESRGCHADDWSTIQVAEDFNAFRIRRVHFKGRCVLGRFDGEVEVLPGMNDIFIQVVESASGKNTQKS